MRQSSDRLVRIAQRCRANPENASDEDIVALAMSVISQARPGPAKRLWHAITGRKT